MKKFCYSLVLIVVCCMMVFTGCSSDKGLKDNPPTNATIVGNGGYAVVKGDYLYYTNGFIEDYKNELDDENTDNVFGEVTFGAIYRTKLSNYSLSKDSNGFLNKTECVVPKVVGFENGGFYIIGDYIYYATPHMEREKESGTNESTLRNDLINFNRIRIDGTGNKSIYVSDTTLIQDQWKLYSIGEDVYLVVAETESSKTTLKSIKITSKGKATETTLATDVTSYALYEDKINNSATQNIYFTSAVSDGSSFKGNALKCVNITNGNVTPLFESNDTYNVVSYANETLYYTKAVKYNDKTQTELISRSVNNFSSAIENTIFGSSYSKYLVSDFNAEYIVALDSEKALRVSKYGQTEMVLTSGVSSLIDFVGNYVFYLDDNNSIKKVDITADSYIAEDAINTDKTLLNSNAKYVDVNGEKLFVFASYTASDGSTHYYLNMVTGTDAEFVGYFAGGHTPAQPEQDGTIWIS